MKFRFLLLCALPLLAVPSARAGLDFTFQHKTLPADGISLDQLYITDGASKIFLRPPSDWKVFNSGQTLDCATDDHDVLVRLESFPGAKALSIDAAGGQDLLRLATSQLPGEARNVVALPVELNPLPLFGWSTLEVNFHYEYFGQTLRRSVMYLNMLPGRVVEMTVIAPDATFDKIHKQARQFLGSWFEPSRDLPPELQRKYESPEMGGT